VDNFKKEFTVTPEEKLNGPHGTGPIDYAITFIKTGEIIGVTEVKKEDILQGIAQCAVQLESVVFSRKRKADELENELHLEKKSKSEHWESG